VRRLARLALAAGLALVAGLEATIAFAQGAPYRRAGEQALEFRGPGREEPEPVVAEVVLGWFGPADPGHRELGEFWRGAVLGLEAENAAGGYRGAPFRLASAWSDSPWQAGAAQLARLVYVDRAWAVIGGIDGASTHVAEQLALKARFALLSPGSTDPTANCAQVPWLFTALPPDDRQAPVLVERLLREAGTGALAVAATVDHDSHAALVALRREMAARGLQPATVLELDAAEDLGTGAGRLLEARPGAVLVVAPARPAAEIVSALRRGGFGGRILGSAPLASNAFLRAAGSAAEGVLAPSLLEASDSPAWDAFARAYAGRWGGDPDFAAAQSHDAVRFLASAVRRAGLNRARIADALRASAPWSGAAGVLRWDTLGRNQRAVGLACWRGGRLSAEPPSSASGPPPTSPEASPPARRP
jgi:branched-chain amino acid transport system substrate-binding protein